jgi:hypothetical protein
VDIVSPVQCECPRHLAKLVASLDAFEQYSRQCENRSPEDAALHRRLAEGTERARRTMEELLIAVCEAEGIEV